MDLSKMTIKELTDICKEKGIGGYSGKKKADIIAIIAQSTQPRRLKVLSLFSGCGGLDYGFHKRPDFEVLGSYDSMKHAVETYNMNFDSKARLLDVRELVKADFNLGFEPDVVIGGPPCQDFSVAGEKTLGERASLSETFVDIVCKYRPLYFVMENVPTIRTIGKTIYSKIIARLGENYGLSVNVVYMPDYCIPQERKRLVIIGKRGGSDGVFDSLLNAAKTPIRSIREFERCTGIDIGLGGKEHIYRHPRNYSRRGVYSIDELYPTVRGCLRKMPPVYNFHEGDSSKTREEIVSPDWAMIAKIQTFPPSFKFMSKNNSLIIGNAVPPKFSEALANIIATHHALQ